MNKLYDVKVFRNDTAKLAHVLISIISNRKNANLTNMVSKASYAKNKGNNLPKTSTSFTDSFNILLMNSKREDWTQETVKTDVGRDQAKFIKEKLVDEFIESGYIVSDKIHIFGGSSGAYSNKYVNNMDINPNTTDLKKFKTICQKCSLGLDIKAESFNQNLKELYRLMMHGGLTRYDVWKKMKESC